MGQLGTMLSIIITSFFFLLLQTLNLKLLHAGKEKDFIGTYTANLSNAYGWNTSSVAIHCINSEYPE